MGPPKTFKKTCKLCGVNVSGERNFTLHLKGKKHRMKLKQSGLCDEPQISKNSSDCAALDDIKMEEPELAPGEPVPPGLEDLMSSVCQIQPELNAYCSSPLIGLEYLAEAAVNDDLSTLEYFCLLCDKKGPKRIVINHLTSLQHQLNYLKLNFRSVYDYLENLMADPNSKQLVMKITNCVSKKLEMEFGRRKPLVLEKQALLDNKKYFFEKIKNEKRLWDESDISLNDILDGNPEGILKRNVEKQFKLENKQASDAVGVDDGNAESLEDIQVICVVSNPKAKKKKRLSKTKMMFKECKEKSPGAKPSLVNEYEDFKVHVGLRSENDEKNCAADDKLSTVSSKSLGEPSRSQSPSIRKVQRSDRSFILSDRFNPTRRFFQDPHQPLRRRTRSRSHSPLKLRSRSRSRSRSRTRSQSRCSSVSRQRVRCHSRSPMREKMKVGLKRRKSPNLKSPLRQNESKRPHSRSPSNRKTPGSHGIEISGTPSTRKICERSMWDKFRVEADYLELEMAATLRRYEKSPEKHPSYAEEWKVFYGARVKSCGIRRNVNSEELKEEWIVYWGKKMHELHQQEFVRKKDAIRKRLGLPEEKIEQAPILHFEKKKKLFNRASVSLTHDDWIPPAPAKLADRPPSPIIPNPPPLVPASRLDNISDLKTTWKVMTGNDIECRFDRHGVLESDSCKADLIPTLRLVSALEEHLGSLGPQINHYLAQALSLQRTDSSLSSLIITNDIIALFETVKEKLSGQLEAGIVARARVAAVKRTLDAISSFLNSILVHKIPIQSDQVDSAVKHKTVPPETSTSNDIETAVSRMRRLIPAVTPEPAENASKIMQFQDTEDLPVSGVDKVDKVAIAQQIALALIAKGKTNVTEIELQTLVEEVVGLAQAQIKFSCKQSESSTIGRPSGGENAVLNDLLTTVFDRFDTKDTESMDSKHPSKYSLIEVDLEENACKKSYQAHSMRSFSFQGKESNSLESQGMLSATDESKSLQRLPDCAFDNGSRHNLQLVKGEPDVNYTSLSHILSPRVSLHEVNSNPFDEKSMPKIRVKKEFNENPMWESDSNESSQMRTMQNYHETYEQRTGRMYNDGEQSSGFLRRLVHPTPELRHDDAKDSREELSIRDSLKSPISCPNPDPREHFQKDYSESIDPRFRVHTGHQGQSQNPSVDRLHCMSPMERAYCEPRMHSRMFDDRQNVKSDYCGSQNSDHGFSQLNSGRPRHSYDARSSEFYPPQQHTFFFSEGSRYLREDPRYS